MSGVPINYSRDYTCEHGELWGECPHGCVGDSWEPVDLGPYLRGEVRRPEPTIGIRRSDGLRLMYPGKEHSVIGEMESGKSWLLLASTAAELDLGRHVVYLHFEESDPSDTVERLTLLGVTESQMLKLFRFVAPQRQVSHEALARLLDPAPSLVVFDGVNEAMSLHGWGIRDEDGAASFRRHLVMPCTRIGAATVSADHVVKDKEARGRNALGSIHKGNGLSGSLLLLENADPFGRGQRGRSHLFVTKDRPGHLRRHGRPDAKIPGKTFLGELVVDDLQTFTPDLELRLWAPKDPAKATPMPTLDDLVVTTVAKVVAAGKVANLSTVRALLPYRAADVDDALARLVYADKLVETTGSRGARVFTPSGDQLSRGSDDRS